MRREGKEDKDRRVGGQGRRKINRDLETGRKRKTDPEIWKGKRNIRGKEKEGNREKKIRKGRERSEDREGKNGLLFRQNITELDRVSTLVGNRTGPRGGLCGSWNDILCTPSRTALPQLPLASPQPPVDPVWDSWCPAASKIAVSGKP